MAAHGRDRTSPSTSSTTRIPGESGRQGDALFVDQRAAPNAMPASWPSVSALGAAPSSCAAMCTLKDRVHRRFSRRVSAQPTPCNDGKNAPRTDSTARRNANILTAFATTATPHLRRSSLPNTRYGSVAITASRPGDGAASANSVSPYHCRTVAGSTELADDQLALAWRCGGWWCRRDSRHERPTKAAPPLPARSQAVSCSLPSIRRATQPAPRPDGYGQDATPLAPTAPRGLGTNTSRQHSNWHESVHRGHERTANRQPANPPLRSEPARKGCLPGSAPLSHVLGPSTPKGYRPCGLGWPPRARSRGAWRQPETMRTSRPSPASSSASKLTAKYASAQHRRPGARAHASTASGADNDAPPPNRPAGGSFRQLSRAVELIESALVNRGHPAAQADHPHNMPARVTFHRLTHIRAAAPHPHQRRGAGSRYPGLRRHLDPKLLRQLGHRNAEASPSQPRDYLKTYTLLSLVTLGRLLVTPPQNQCPNRSATTMKSSQLYLPKRLRRIGGSKKVVESQLAVAQHRQTQVAPSFRHAQKRHRRRLDCPPLRSALRERFLQQAHAVRPHQLRSRSWLEMFPTAIHQDVPSRFAPVRVAPRRQRVKEDGARPLPRCVNGRVPVISGNEERSILGMPPITFSSDRDVVACNIPHASSNSPGGSDPRLLGDGPNNRKPTAQVLH